MAKMPSGIWRSLSDNGSYANATTSAGVVVSAVTATSISNTGSLRGSSGEPPGAVGSGAKEEGAFVAGVAAAVETIATPALLLRHTLDGGVSLLRLNSHARLFFDIDTTHVSLVSSTASLETDTRFNLTLLDERIDGLSQWLSDAIVNRSNACSEDATSLSKHFDAASAHLSFLSTNIQTPHSNNLILSRVSTSLTTQHTSTAVSPTLALLTIQPMPVFHPRASHVSRYETDFEELQCIGRGGFGTVFRVRNKLDGQEYAIKKIKCNNVARLQNEVQTFARISNHPNIIRYYAAWTEPILFSNIDNDGGDDYDCSGESSGFSSQDSEDLYFDDAMFGRNASFPSRRRARSLARASRKNASSPALMLNVSTSIQEERLLMNSINRDRRRRQKLFQRRRSCSTSSRPTMVLFIQMQLCPSTDLRRYLQTLSGTQLSSTQITSHLQIFRQIVSALSFLHAQNVVHLDLKPDNIFITPSHHVYLGDFGLAKSVSATSSSSVSPMSAPVTRSRDSPSDTNSPLAPFPLDLSSLDLMSDDASSNLKSTLIDSHSHVSSDGTYLYTSPDHTLTIASDMYALGIVLVELMTPFATLMERAKVLTRVKVTGEPPEGMKMLDGVWGCCKKCLSPSPADRPSCSDVMSMVDTWLAM